MRKSYRFFWRSGNACPVFIGIWVVDYSGLVRLVVLHCVGEHGIPFRVGLVGSSSIIPF